MGLNSINASTRAWGFCPSCGQPNERLFNRDTGRFLVTYPSKCPSKDKCASRILNGNVDGAPRRRLKAHSHD